MRQHDKLCLVCACSVMSDTLQPPGSSVHGILQARILEWVAFPPPRDLPNLGIEPAALASTGEFFLPLVPPGKPTKVSTTK